MSPKKVLSVLISAFLTAGSAAACSFQAPDPHVTTAPGVPEVSSSKAKESGQAVSAGSVSLSETLPADPSLSSAQTVTGDTQTAPAETYTVPAESSVKQEESQSSAAVSQKPAVSTAAPEPVEESLKPTSAESSETKQETPVTEAQAVPSALRVAPQSPLKAEEAFKDSLFIGGSRIQGLMLYGRLFDAGYIYGKGFNVGRYYDTDLGIEGGGTAAQLVARNAGKFKHIYLAFGINECGWPLPNFINAYTGVVRHVMENNPQAIIYVQAILPTTAKQESSPYFNNANLRKFNQAIAQMTADLGVYYLDPTSALAGADGRLPAEASPDGIHFNKSYVLKWQNYIQTHVAPGK